ncbi:MAG TPA: bifunctional adenosylcobinamide kinase/adenosylcobinamide-phosphate guanylyltransferase [Gaiellaceae bacterium]|nr:bifunctional adenosylcobinamide kinase/adenosylcobinamide-phosphate guanylyltransferase [Gaiellaceae bacterium]
MTLVVLIGGARSGKSRAAVELARTVAAPVTFVATGWAGDEEMAERIARHREERPPEWTTVEEPRELARALRAVPAGETAIVDCLSLWVANLEGAAAPAEAAEVAAARDGLTIAVTNEVGMGIVPDNAVAREYRDELGRVNAHWAELADEAWLVVAGKRLRLS